MANLTKSLLVMLLIAAILVGCSSDANKSGDQAQAGDYKASPKAPPGKG